MENPSDPIISVVVPTYRHVHFINDCLEGILKQNVNVPFEVIIGEDGSDDGTREICLWFLNKYPKIIKVLLNERDNVIYIEGSPTGRRNLIKLLQAAKGKFIAICEGDDFWLDPNKLQSQFDVLSKDEDIVGCYHDTVVIDVKGQVLRKFREKLPKRFGVDNIISMSSPSIYQV